jgi:hypothetical protein
MAIRRNGLISYNPYTAGKVIYSNGTHHPTSGPVSADGQQGYDERDRRIRVRRNALLAYQKAKQAGQYAGANYLRKAG